MDTNNINKMEDNRKDSKVVACFPYFSPTPGELPIICMGGFDTAKEDEIRKQSDLRMSEYMKYELTEIINCGFNAVLRYITKDAEKFNICINLSLANNLKFIASFLSKSVYPTLDDYRQYANQALSNIDNKFASLFLVDEPKYSDLQSFWSPIYNSIYSYLQTVNIYKNRILFFNLNAGTNEENVGPYYTNNYLGYLENVILQNFRPSVWCYDVYPCVVQNNEIITNPAFYPRLEEFSRISNQTNRPFYAFAQCMQYTTVSSSGYKYITAEPTVERMRFECFMALAFGAQGIIFWSFRQQNDEPQTSFGQAPFTRNDSKTIIYNYVAKVIAEIKKYSYIFLGSHLMDYKHYPLVITSDQPVEQIKPLSNLICHLMGVVATYLKNNEKNYLVIVNKSSENSQSVTLTFEEGVKYNLLTTQYINKNEVETSKSISIPLTYDLEAGGYLIFEWEYV